MNEKLSHIHIEKLHAKAWSFFYVDPCEQAVPWAGRKEDTNKSEIRQQTLAI